MPARKSCLAVHMNFFKRATTSITRRPGKTVILMLLVFILGTVTAGAISVQGAIQNTDANLRARMQPIVSISEDWQARQESEAVQRWNELTADWTWDWDGNGTGEWDQFWELHPDHPYSDYFPTHEQLLPEHIRAVGQLPYVYFYDFIIQTSLQSFALQMYTDLGHNRWHDDWAPEWFRMFGTSSTNMVQIDQEVINLVQGEQFSTSDLIAGGNQAPVIVSQLWANLNGLSIGSTFDLYNIVHTVNPDPDVWVNWGPEMFEDDNIWELVTMEFRVIGLFDIPDNDNDNNDSWRIEQLLNTFYTPNWVLEDLHRRTALATVAALEDAGVEDGVSWWQDQIDDDDEFGGMHITPLFILNDPRDIENFRQEAHELIPNYHRIQDMSSAFDDIESSMATMETISFWVLWVSVGATLLILTLLITLFLRDRRYEMGVYLAIGEKKSKIVSQILLEVVVTASVGITLAVFAGHFISSELSNNMLMTELQAAREPDPSDWWSGGGVWNDSVFEQIGIPTQEMSIPEMAEAFQVRLGFDTILMFYGIGLGAVVLSTLIPVIYVVTLKPKKVLM